jgi:hypothetical protein
MKIPQNWHHRATRMTIVGSFACLAASSALADVWDLAGDAAAGTTANVLWHTAPAQRHDLANSGGTPDQDWYKVFPRANRSYEVQVVNASVNLWAGFGVSRTTTGGVLLESSAGLDPVGSTRALRWIQGVTDTEERVQVLGTASSTANAQYDIQLRETTLFCPRYNNSGTQTSVLIVQRASTETGPGICQVNAYFYDENAILIAMYPQTLVPNDMSATATALIPNLTVAKGALHIAHTCGVGGLKGKLVALEPSTGFSFDTPCTERDR